MLSDNQIRYVKRNEIDVSSWNNCINKASNGLIYAQSYFLDVICTNWDAIVLNDYESVMPLPWRKKWGFYYIYPPYFVSVLGVFGTGLSPSLTESFLSHIPKKFRFWEIDLNERNGINIFPKLKAEKRKNIFLHLNTSYQVLTNDYKRLAKRKLNMALENNLTLHHETPPSEIIYYYEKHYEEKSRIIPREAYTRLQLLFNVIPKESYRTYLVKKQNKIAAFYIVLVDQNNIYSLIGGSTEEGKKYGAFYLATDAAIKDFSGTGKIFRFEGSDKEGIAFFNLQFGSFEIDYLRIKMNNLPWPLHFFK